MKDYNGIISKIIKQTHNVKTFRINMGEKFDFLAGQYAMIITENKKNGKIARAFSLTNAPGKKYIEITMKIEGEMTGLMDREKIGDKLKIRGPLGSFTLDSSNDDIVFIAGGVGITPFISMMRHLKQTKSRRHITFLYSAKTPEDFVYFEELKKMCTDKNVSCGIFTITADSVEWRGKIGRIDRVMIKENVRNIKESTFYICGPPQMIESMINILYELGVEKKKIRIERW